MDDPRNLWQTQEVEEMKFPVEELRAKAVKFHSRIRWRNWREYAACLFVIVMFARNAWKTPNTVERIGFALIIVGAIYVMWHLWARGSAKSLPADMGRADCVRFYQSELARQRDLLRGIWKWYIGPLIPGMALICVYFIVIPPSGHRWISVANAVFQAAVISGVGWLNKRAARRIDRRIAELDRELGGM
jgi:hypothetical protein